VTLSPRPWTELFPSEIDGKPTRTYFHWLAAAYAVTIVGHPAISLPVGLDRNGMPFGLQIVGPRGGDAKVLAVAAALEAGALGARMTGGGFGGCTVSLVAAEAVEAFAARLSEAYRAATGLVPDVFACSPSAVAGEIDPRGEAP